MKKVTFVAILLVSLSFTAFQTNDMGLDDAISTNTSKDTLATDTLQEDSNIKEEVSVNDTLDTKNLLEKSEENIHLNSLGKVSWYGGKFHGRLTSSGERYDMNAFTAAHKTLPFGTKVRIRNPKNGKEVIVRITDRGPFVPKREFDLSKAAFSELASLNSGVLNVQYEIL